MKLNLDALKTDILEQLRADGFVVFHGHCRNGQSRPVAYWDTARVPEFQSFLAAARQTGAKMVVFNQVQFFEGMVEDALEQLEECELPVEERRGYERRLREMSAFQGFTCALELSFDTEARSFVYEVQADWYSDFLRIVDDLDSYSHEGEEEGEKGSMGGYFSRN
jgi:hypothetical protein